MTGLINISNPKFADFMAALMSREFRVDFCWAHSAIDSKFMPILQCLKKDIIVFVETDYVDKVYRDSYYNYFASKADRISRNCIRMSLLDNASSCFHEGNLDYHQYDEIRKNYLGFLIIRPTVPAVIGRSAISPCALTHHDFRCCLAPIKSTVSGFKVEVEAFPFSSQDRETITCAETTLWTLMEYYGNKYAEYRPVAPSEIIENLESNTACRQLPSNGLSVENVAYALKTFGFGPQLYGYPSFGSRSPNILSCYIESGIPVVVALSNDQAFVSSGTAPIAGQRINHAVLCIGHENVSIRDIDANLKANTKTVKASYGALNILDYDDIEKRFVFIDDNCPPYQKDFLSTPANRYVGKVDWNSCRISNFVAPLYKRIYMEPFVAKEYALRILLSGYYSHLNAKTVIVRTYLCSTRSFRQYVNESAMTNAMKDMVSGAFMPKFVWITEVSKVESVKIGLVDNLIIVDATGYETAYFMPLLLAFVDNACYCKDSKSMSLVKYDIPTTQFNSYSNLK